MRPHLAVELTDEQIFWAVLKHFNCDFWSGFTMIYGERWVNQLTKYLRIHEYSLSGGTLTLWYAPFSKFRMLKKRGNGLKKFRIMPKWTFHGLHRLLGLIWAWESQIWGQKWCQTTDSLDYRALNRHIIQFSALSPSCTAFHTYYMYYTYQFPNIWCKYLKKAW